MVFNLKDFKDVCSKILTAVDSSDGSQITDTLSLQVSDNLLVLSATNREYFVKVRMPVEDSGNLNASVNAGIFLKLVSSLTSETISLSISGNSLKVVADGTFRIPLIYDGEDMLRLPEISIVNETQNFDIDTKNLINILVYNSKEANKKTRFAVQKMYYLDSEGCITFTSGACINKFSLDGEVKILLTAKVVKLFKLFNSDKVNFSLGYDELPNGFIQAKAVFSNEAVVVSTVLPNDDSLISSVPAAKIRETAFSTYDYSVNINKDAVLNAMKRFLIFSNDVSKCLVTINFTDDEITIVDEIGNEEKIPYSNNQEIRCNYSLKLFAEDLRLTLESVADKFVVFNFGNHRAVVIAKGNIYNVVPEVIAS